MSGRAMTLMGVALVMTACGPGLELPGEALESNEFSLRLAAPEAQAVLAFVNAPSTTEALLRDDVRLDSRAAANLVARRAQRLFVSLEDLTTVAYVKDTALQKLHAYVSTHAAPPEVVEGVAFSSPQVVAVLAGVNTASLETLDGPVGLDARAAQNLVAARPFASLTALGAVAHVGASALTKLRDYAAIWGSQAVTSGEAGTYDGVVFDEPVARTALELARTATAVDLKAHGVTTSATTAIIEGRPYASLTQVSAESGVGPATMAALHAWASALVAPVSGNVGEDGECVAPSDCESGLVCSGLTFGAQGWCRAEALTGRFSNDTAQSVGDGATVVSALTVSGLASVPEDVIVEVNLSHPDPAELRVTLEQPNTGGQEIVLCGAGTSCTSGLNRVVVINGVERDNVVNGEWLLRVSDTQAGQTGAVLGWSLQLTSRWD